LFHAGLEVNVPSLEREITTRAYELDSHGLIPPAVLLRYLEHTRWEAGYDRGSAMSGLFHGGSRMVVRGQRLSVARPLRRGEHLVISLWLEELGRTSMTMGQRVVERATGEELATSTVVGVSIDAAGRPVALPDAVRALLAPTGRPHARIEVQDAPPGAFVTRTTVRPSDTDVLQHVNHARYADWVEDARALGIAAGALGAGVRWTPPTRLSIEYTRECLVGQPVELLAWDAGPGTVQLEGRVGDERALAFRAEVTA
jgi:YbgC/YbaW family acyl-CoA thioester hydrolase